jgi:hypothetical protein
MKIEPETGDPVWELLTKSKNVEPSPFFARNILRELRRIEEEPAGFFEQLRNFAGVFQNPRILITASACAALALTLFLNMNPDRALLDESVSGSIVNLEDHSDAFDPASEMAAVEYLGQLMAVADPGQLDDSSLADLFF